LECYGGHAAVKQDPERRAQIFEGGIQANDQCIRCEKHAAYLMRVVLGQNTLATRTALKASLTGLHAQLVNIYPGDFMGRSYPVTETLEQVNRTSFFMNAIIEDENTHTTPFLLDELKRR
jgi:hypothetical protein